MDEKLENIIRQWGRRGPVPIAAPRGAPCPSCLSYADAEAIAAGQAAAAEQLQHVAGCGHCRKLLADFREAMAELTTAKPRAAGRVVRMLRPVGMALAASLVLAACVGVFFATRTKASPALLAWAEVGLQSQIQAGLTPKAPQRFATGQAIMFRAGLNRPSYVTLINVDARGRVTALPPTASSDLVAPLPAGKALLGPYRLDENTGPETFFVVASPSPLPDLVDRVRLLQARRDGGADAEQLALAIRSWPAEVKAIAFDHVSPPTTGE